MLGVRRAYALTGKLKGLGLCLLCFFFKSSTDKRPVLVLFATQQGLSEKVNMFAVNFVVSVGELSGLLSLSLLLSQNQ